MKIISFSLLLAIVAPGLAEETRYRDPVTLHDEHPFRSLRENQSWEERSTEIKIRIQLAAGLFPFPERTDLNAQRFGPVEGEGFRVEKVFFESFPGHYVTGSLFTPSGSSLQKGLQDGKRPGVLCPHGHWTDGRLYDSLTRGGGRGAREQIAKGAERFWNASRNPIVARCVQLARMGCVVLVYDTIGNADSIQLTEHRRGPRPEMDKSELGEWGFVSPQSTLRLQTNFGLQTWNSVRALDYLTTLQEVDTDRLLVTGASGGATQTMILAAIDERIDAAFPAVMVSTAMQGGCTCENSHYLRIDQGNIDIAAAVAPRPLGLTAADDWTVELETKGHPDLETLYTSLKCPDHYESHFDIHFGHNFNHVSRGNLYNFVNRHFKLGETEPVLEEDFVYLGRPQLSVWSDPNRIPESYLTGPDHERELNRLWAEDSHARWKQAADGNKNGVDSWLRAAWETILRKSALDGEEYVFTLGDKDSEGEVVVMDGTIENAGSTSPIAARIHYPKNWNGNVIIQLGDQGHATEVQVKDTAVICLDLYGQNDDKALNPASTYSGKKELDANSWQRSPVYFYGYNDSVWVRRVHDLVAAIRMAEQHPDWDVKKISILARGPLASIALGAKALAGESLEGSDIDPEGFRFSAIDSNWDDYMVPGAVKYGDVDGLRLIARER